MIATAENAPHTTDILKRPNEYRLSIQANPTVPVLDIYAEAPDDAAAKKLASGAVSGLQRLPRPGLRAAGDARLGAGRSCSSSGRSGAE